MISFGLPLLRYEFLCYKGRAHARTTRFVPCRSTNVHPLQLPCAHAAPSTFVPEHNYYLYTCHHTGRTWLQFCWLWFVCCLLVKNDTFTFTDVSTTQCGILILETAGNEGDIQLYCYVCVEHEQQSAHTGLFGSNVLYHSMDGPAWVWP